MKKQWMSASVAMLVAAVLALPSPTLAQKGKGGGNGGGKGGGKGGGHLPAPGNGKAEPARPFEHPNSGNSLPQSTRDKLPPGLRDKPENQPGTSNHLRKLGDDKPAERLDPEPRRLLRPDQTPARPFAQPGSGNSLPQEIRDKLPPGLRDMPENHPGLANHLRKMGVLKDYPAIDPVPQQIRSQMPQGLRDLPYYDPGVANYLGRLGWSIDEDGTLIPPLPPPTVTPFAPGPVLPRSFQPFGGIFRRR